jgi:hypothetical protein
MVCVASKLQPCHVARTSQLRCNYVELVHVAKRATVPLKPEAPTRVCRRQRAAVVNRRQTTGGGCKDRGSRCGTGICPRADGSSQPLATVPIGPDFDGEGPNLPAHRIARVRRDGCTSPRRRCTIGCQADERRLQRTTGGCNGRPAADDVQQTERGSDAVCAPPAAGPMQLPAAVARRIGAALLGNIWRGCSAALRSSTTQVETASERGCGSPNRANGRCGCGSTNSTKNTVPLGANLSGGCALGVAAPNCVSELFSLAFHGCPIDELRPLVVPLRKVCCVHHCQLFADLGHAPVMSSASIVGSGPTLALLRW